MTKQLSSSFFKNNRQTLRKMFSGKAPIVITSHGLMQKSTDTTFPFKQESNFWYLTGIDEPNVTLVIDKDREYLIIPVLSDVREKFDGSIDVKALQDTSGIEDIVNESEGWRRLGRKLKRSGSVAIVSPPKAYIEQMGMYTNPSRRRLVSKIKTYNKDIEFLDLKPHFQRMRMIKQPEELAVLQEAIDITMYALKKVRAKFARGGYKNEFEVEQDLSKYFFEKGAEGYSFDPIIAAGAKACTIHPTGNIHPLRQKDVLLLDVGASYNSYAADISRTWHAKPSKRLQAVHKAIIEVSDYALSILKPGVILPEYEAQIETYMGEKLRELGLIKSITSPEVRKYYPHATSHFLGVDVHDIGLYESPLKEGTVITVEPGIYIPEEGIGVRIEDDVLITHSGIKNLSAKLSRSL